MEISLDEQTLGGLNEAASDEAFKDFLGSLTARSADEIRREFEEKIRASPENAERLFFSAETEFFKGYYLYKKGDKQVKDNNDKYNTAKCEMISQQFIVFSESSRKTAR